MKIDIHATSLIPIQRDSRAGGFDPVYVLSHLFRSCHTCVIVSEALPQRLLSFQEESDALADVDDRKVQR